MYQRLIDAIAIALISWRINADSIEFARTIQQTILITSILFLYVEEFTKETDFERREQKLHITAYYGIQDGGGSSRFVTIFHGGLPNLLWY